MTTESWLAGYIHAFEFYQGVPENVIPNNLKAGVIKSDYSEPLLNTAYRQLADYYQFTIIPARVEKPKDKSSVEGNVGFVSRQVIAALRNETYLTLKNLNQAIFEKIQELNQETFQKRPGSRHSVFHKEEQPYLMQLRQPRFILAYWRITKVGLNYHIQVDRIFYSVPYEYANNEVEVKLTDILVKVFFNEHRIASHKPLKGDVEQYATLIEHMSKQHQKHLAHTSRK